MNDFDFDLDFDISDFDVIRFIEHRTRARAARADPSAAT